MNRILLTIAVAGAIALGGCSAAQLQTAGQNVAAVNSAALGAVQTTAASIASLCPVGQTILNAAATAAANPTMVVAQDANGLFCAVNKAIATTATVPAAASAPTAAAVPQ